MTISKNPTNSDLQLDTIVKFARRKGFVFQSSEIYGGFAATYDFGPLGSILRENLINAWRYWNVIGRTDVEEIQGAIFMHPKVWEASGHIGGFSDLLVEDTVTRKRYRADHLIEDAGLALPPSLRNKYTANIENPGKAPLSRGQGVIPEALDENGRIKFNPSLIERAEEMAKNMTKSEKKLWFEILNSSKTGYKWQKQKIIFDYIVDFYCSELLLIIEVDGSSHDNKTEYDTQRQNFLESLNLKVLRISNEDIENNLEGVFLLIQETTNNLSNSNIQNSKPLKEYPESTTHPLKGVQDRNNIITNAGVFTPEEIDQIIEYHDLKSPDGNPLGKAKSFNLMVKTHLGPVEDETNVAYLKGESCQNIYIDWKQVQETTRRKLPFGIAQLGKAFRNEITVKQFMFRTREFEQIDLQYFVKPGTEDGWYQNWKQNRWDFYTKYLEIDENNLNYRKHDDDELIFYCTEAWDMEYNFGALGYKEMEGVHNRTSYDTDQHSKFSDQDLSYFDPLIEDKDKQRYNPYIVEMSAGLNRMFLALLFEFYKEEQLEEGGTRIVLKLPYHLAPYKIAVLPLMKKDGLKEKAHEIYAEFRKSGLMATYDETGSIGKRYRRQDENGTPWCMTVDYDTMKDGTVTLRNRDTMEQQRVKLEEVRGVIEE